MVTDTDPVAAESILPTGPDPVVESGPFGDRLGVRKIPPREEPVERIAPGGERPNQGETDQDQITPYNGCQQRNRGNQESSDGVRDGAGPTPTVAREHRCGMLWHGNP